MQTKKGQLSFFVLIGLVMLIFVSIIFTINSGFEKDYKRDTASNALAALSTTENLVVFCLEETAKEGIAYIAAKGGYYYLPEDYFLVNSSPVPYYYYYGTTKYMPSASEMRLNLADYISENIGFCIDSYNFTGISYEPGSVDVSEKNGKLFIGLKMPVKVSRGNLVSRYDDFFAVVPFSFDELSFVAATIVTRSVMDPYHIYYNDLFDVIESYGVGIDILTNSYDTVVYVVHYNSSGIAFDYMFASVFNATNTAPKLELPAVLNATLGKRFVYNVSASDRENDWLEFYDDTELFDIGMFSGTIDFVPAEKGKFEITITVSDGKLNSSKSTLLVVE